MDSAVQSPFRGRDGTGEPEYRLTRKTSKEYWLDSQFCYVEPIDDQPVGVGDPGEHGGTSDRRERRFLVPKRGHRMVTDLASIPPFLTWLVPKDGSHTPAALLHDALMPHAELYYEGPSVDRVEADRIFRNAMQHLGVAFLRRWAMWGAVSLATFLGPRPWSAGLPGRAGVLARAFVVVLVTIVVGVLAIAAWTDLFDQEFRTPCHVGRSDVPCAHDGVPGMRGASFAREVLGLTGLTAGLAAVAGLSAALVRGVSEVIGGHRSWLRALTFVIHAAALMVYAVPIALAGIGWLGYFALEWAAFGALWALRLPQRAMRHIRGLGSALDHLEGPINPPRVLRR